MEPCCSAYRRNTRCRRAIARRFDGVVHVVTFGNRGDDKLAETAEATGGLPVFDSGP